MKKLILILIIVLAGLLRFWNLGQVPPSPDWDEASLGWNAYSIAETGRDEYGAFLPLILRSFDDYKPAIYTYLVIFPQKIFGLNVFAVRFPAALLGTVAVLLVYLLVKELLKEYKARENIALVSSFLLAISPWHIQFSRIAFESNIGVLVDILIALFFIKGMRKNGYFLLSAFFAGLNLYVYQAEKVFTPLLFLGLLIIYYRFWIKANIKYIFATVVVGILMLIPFVWLTLTTPEIFLRARGTSIAADQTVFLAKNVERLIWNQQNNDRLGLLLDNRRVTYSQAFVNGYLAHFDFNWLFINGDEPRHHAPFMGLMYLWEAPFLLWGIYSLVFSKIDKKAKWLIIGWLLIAPIPASFSSGAPHAVRTLRFLPMIQIITAFGLLAFWQWIKDLKRRYKYIILGILILFSIFNFSYYINQYFVQQNYYYSEFWQYGYKPAIEEVKVIENRYDRIVVSNQPHLDQSYMFFLFYLKYNPRDYQASGGTVSGGFREDHKGFGKYTFRPIKWDEEEKNSKTLFIGRPDDFPEDVKVIKQIDFLNDKAAIVIVEG